MGVPKFFRYISERYPCLSEFVKEYQIPVFDNLYLDMNGIIHMCSHPDDNNPHFRITEEKIFADIFHYIEVLFRMIKPQKVFFMAVDGVAPRAKMNQQRGRRFRSAKDAEKLEKEAVRKGETLPDVERFDSNCITPGTEFMARLHEQLKYFVVHKISTDKMWKRCRVILSGHETPGEGEHKIMDYIRYIRSQPGYDPNTRHCLYGLDADLIMLGLCTHDPHFSLLREEVKFGKKTKRTSVPEEIRFYLLHLSLMREYLELEFGPLKEMLKNVDKVEFDIEKIIDDWILMGFLVGNDFIPNLPNLHIANGALPVLYQAYIEVLPTLDGYINEAGTLNLERFEKFMKKLADIDFKNFEETQEDLLYMEAKSGRKQTIHTPVHSKIKDDEVDIEVNSSPRDPDLARLIQGTDELDISSEEESDKLSSSNEDEAFKNFKDEYYMNKLEYRKVTREVMREQAEGYVRAIQWNLNYYYNGVCSWSWFYPHHYSPYISDIKGFSNLKIEFELGKPFKPYEQLLAVLPTASKNLLPKSYHHLMTDENSVIKAYYPEEFQTDLNGKRQEWEAVVLVPFIDENILLEAMKPCNENLTLDEIKRNQHGPMLVYEYTDDDFGIYEAPKYFPNIRNRAKCTPVIMEDIRVSKEKLIKGAYPGAVFDVFYPGFPTMKHLKYTSELKKTKVKVFETPSRNENMILKILPGEEYFGDSLPVDLLGDTIWVGWPHLVEAKVIGVSNRRQKYVYSENDSRGFKVEEKVLFDSELEGVTQHYRDRLGIELGNTDILVHVQLMIGRRYVFTSGRRVNLEKQFSKIPSTYPLQSIVSNIKVHDEYQSTFSDIDDVFPTGSVCFSLTHPHYGSQGIIMDSKETLKNNHLKVSLLVVEEPDFKPVMEIHDRLKNSYMSLTNAASQLALSNYVFSRITGSLFVSTRNSEGSFKSVNIGLDLKFNKKNQETPGYTKKIDNVWLYTFKAVNLVKMYVEKFPEVFAYLSTSGDDEIMAEALFPDESEEKVKSIQVWLKTLPTHNIDRRVCGSSVLEQEIVEELEKIVDKIQDSPKDLVMQIKPQLLYKPEIQAGNLAPDPLVQTRVFDRIVNVREGFTVPLGLKGTVVAIHKSSNSPNEDEMYDVVFDKTFAGGMSLNCSDHRGYRLPKSSFINLTYGKRHMEQKTGVPGALRALAKERRTAHTFNNSHNTPINLRKQNSAFASFNNLVPFPQMKPPQYKNFQNQPRPHQQVNPTHDQANIKNSFYYMTDFTQTYDPKINKENSFNKRYLPMSVHNPPQMPQGPPKISKENSVNRRNLNTQEGIQGPSSSNPKENPRNIVLNVHNPPQSVRGSLNLNSGPVNLKPKTEVNTDFLRKILNIQANSNNTKSNGPQQASTTTWNQSRTQTNKEPNPSCATAKLLSHYQSSLLGCPRYTYLEEQGGFRAQVALPNGKVICGRIAKTREEASENVARDALNVLQNPNLLKEGLPSQFPVPPTKWVQERQPQNKMNSQIYVNKSHQMKQHQKVGGYFTNKADPEVNFTRSFDNLQHNSRVNSNSNTPNFVPLQALKKRQTHRTASNVNRSFSDSSQCTKSQTSDNSKSTKQLTDFSKLNSTESRENAEKTARQRKTRIAANFKQ